MFEWVFGLPVPLLGVSIVTLFVLIGLIGFAVVRRLVLSRLTMHREDSGFTGAVFHGVVVLYGLLVALVAVAVYESHVEVSRIVTREATQLAALYRDVTAYPDPPRARLQSDIRRYTEYVIQEAWPQQRRGEVPRGGVELVDRFQATLVGFEPSTEGQKILHGETLRIYNSMVEARRTRLDAVSAGLSSAMWILVVLGALSALSSSYFFEVEDERLHQILVSHVAFFIGLVIFVIVAYDRPFRGDLGVPPDSYQLVYDQLMNR